MLDYLPRDPGHARRLPSEHIFICPEESNELEFLLSRKIGPDMGDLTGVSLNDIDGLDGLVSSHDFLRLSVI